MIINFLHGDSDTFSPQNALRINYNYSMNFRYSFWSQKYVFPHWFSEEALDLLYISYSIFIADRLCSRSTASDEWSRDFTLYIPVLSDKWELNKGLLKDMLDFLSGDHWNIEFRKREYSEIEKKSKIRWEKAVTKSDVEIKDYQTICMFSGGLDSFIGSIDLLEDKYDGSILFVSHYGGGKGTKEYQDYLISRFRNEYGNAGFDFLQYHASVVHGIEDTTRTRSFMFFSHAIALATAMSGDIKLIIPENGLISLNIPMTYSRIGTSSTRTTHPYYMYLFRQLLKNIGIDITIENPYQFKTKGEMLMECRNQEFLKANVSHTMSCSHPDIGRMRGEKETMHCGHCLPCVVRQSALKRAGIHDSSRYYDSKCNSGPNARTILNSYRQGIADFDESKAFMSIQLNGPITENIVDFADLYVRGMKEIEQYIEEL